MGDNILLDAILDAINKANKTKLIEKILELVLKNNELLESIKERKKRKKLNGDGWEAGDDDCEVLKGHLEAESIDKLKEFEAALTSKPAPKTKASFKLDGMFAGIGQLVEIFTGLFTGAGGGFLGKLMQMFHQFNVSIDSNIALIKEEMDASVHGKFFSNLGKTNKEINGVYRDLIEKNNNDQQVFNGLLRHVKTLHPKQSKDAHKILKAAEYQLLGGRFTEEGMANKVAARVTANLEQAIAKANTIHPSSTGSATMLPLSKHENKIESANLAVRSLVQLIKKQEEQLTSSHLKKDDKLKVYFETINNRRKLLHFIVKTDALANGKTLSAEKPFSCDAMLQQLDKIPEYSVVENIVESKKQLFQADPATKTTGIFNLFEKQAAAGAPTYFLNNLANQEKYQEAIKTAQDKAATAKAEAAAQAEAEAAAKAAEEAAKAKAAEDAAKAEAAAKPRARERARARSAY